MCIFALYSIALFIHHCLITYCIQYENDKEEAEEKKNTRTHSKLHCIYTVNRVYSYRKEPIEIYTFCMKKKKNSSILIKIHIE